MLTNATAVCLASKAQRRLEGQARQIIFGVIYLGPERGIIRQIIEMAVSVAAIIRLLAIRPLAIRPLPTRP